MRWYLGEGAYKVGAIGAADDNQDADGTIILDFRQARAKARELVERRKREAASLPTKTGPYTASRSIVEYLEWMERSRKSAQDARYRAEGIILPALGAIACDALSKWRRGDRDGGGYKNDGR
jgi:hypothetical protein